MLGDASFPPSPRMRGEGGNQDFNPRPKGRGLKTSLQTQNKGKNYRLKFE